ncbi:hypothetical protein [Bacillus sp. EB01]|uniref:hypothetical protein n=1 Tax=Bacillus sp. EB01 TaxID=1347086 RepID=UPI0005C78D24|nr:hypothetical protein [Bacillus sp. EB01]
MSLKLALSELKEMMLQPHQAQVGEEEIHQLETKYGLSKDSLIFYYNNLMMLGLNQTQDQGESKKVNRKWSKAEIDFLFLYLKERQEEGARNITELLDEAANLLGRGYQSVSYKYYTLAKKQQKTQKVEQPQVEFVTISENDVPVVSTEFIEPINAPAGSMAKKPSQDGDLIDILSGLISNVEQLPGINLHEMLRSLYQLTNMALLNQQAATEIENMKSEINSEKEVLRNKLKKQEQQLNQERQRNIELQNEVSRLAREIHAFSQLGDAAKIQNLKSYNQRLNYLIDSSGVVHQVGS